jgi:hypothetical protein
MATSATDLILPVGLLLWIFMTQFSVFFILLWKGGRIKDRISFSSIFGLITSVLSFALGIAPQPNEWVYDNQTVTYVYTYMVQQGQGLDFYLGFLVLEFFLVIASALKLMLETDLLGGSSE